MRKVVLVLAILVGVVIAAVLVGPSFVDWNQYKQPLIAQVEAATGRKVTIDGDLSLSLLPTPRLSASGVTMSNVPGATVPEMLRLDTARVRVATAPLVRLQIEVESVELLAPRIELERLADGTVNWSFGPPADAESPGSTPGPDTAAGNERRPLPQVRFNDIRIRNGTLIYRDGVTGTVERLESINLGLVASSLSGPFRAEGDLTARGVPVDLRLALGQLVENRGIPLSFGLTATDVATSAEFSGVLSGFPTAPSISGSVSLASDDLAAAASRISAASVPILSGPAAVDADVSFTAGLLALNDLHVRLSDVTASGTAEVVFDGVPRIDLKIDAQRVDLDALLARARAAPVAATPPPVGDDGTLSLPGAGVADVVPGAQPTAFSLPQTLAANVELGIDALAFNGGIVRQVTVAGELVNGEFLLNQARAQMPGGSDISVFGFLAPVDGEPVFDGQVEAGSDNLRGLLAWLGQDVGAVPVDRLRKLELSAKVRLAPGDLTISAIDTQVDFSRIRGGIAVALRRRPGFGIGLSIDRVNLDAYLADPAAVSDAPADQSLDQTLDAPADDASEAPSDAPNQDPGTLLAMLGVLDRFDAILQLQVGTLTFAGTPASGMSFDGTLQGGNLTLREVGIADIANTALRVQGDITSLADTPAVDLRLSAQSADTARFAELIPGLPEVPLRDADLTARVTGDSEELAVNAVLKALSGEIALTGTLATLNTAPAYDVRLNASHPSVAGLVADLSDRGLTAGDPGRVAISGTLAGDASAAQVDLAAQLGDGALTVVGNLANPLTGASGNLDISIDHPNLTTLIQTFRPQYAPALTDLGAFNLTAGGRIDPGRVVLSGIVGAAGPVALQGDAAFDFTGPRPAVTANLATSEIVLDWFLAPVGAIAGISPAAADPAAPATDDGVSRDTRRWSRDPIDLATVVGWDADISLSAPAINQGAFRILAPQVSASVESGTVSLDRFSGEIFDGEFSITGSLAGAELPDLSILVSLSGTDAAKFTQAIRAARESGSNMSVGLLELIFPVSGVELVAGSLGAELAVTTAGRSEFELISNLTGNGEVSFAGAVVDGVDVCRVSTQLDNLDGLDGFLGIVGAASGGTTQFDDFIGRFALDRGVADIPSQRLLSQCANATVSGTVDLPRWLVDLQARVQLPEHPEFPGILVQERGALDAPDARLVNVNEIQQYLITRAAGSLLQDLLVPEPQPQPEAPAANPEQTETPPQTIDPFRSLLEGLIR